MERWKILSAWNGWAIISKRVLIVAWGRALRIPFFLRFVIFVTSTRHTFLRNDVRLWSVWISFNLGSIRKSARYVVTARRLAQQKPSPGKRRRLQRTILRSVFAVVRASRPV